MDRGFPVGEGSNREGSKPKIFRFAIVMAGVRGKGYLTEFEIRQTLTARLLLLVPLSVKTPLGRSTSRYFDRRQAYFDFRRVQLKVKILTPLKIVRKFLTIFLKLSQFQFLKNLTNKQMGEYWQ